MNPRLFQNISNDPGPRGRRESKQITKKAQATRRAEIRELDQLRRRKILPRHEKFLRELIMDPTCDQPSAARRCGYKAASKTAIDILKRPEVQERYAELTEQVNEKAQITLEMLRERLMELANQAQDEGRYAAAVRAIELLMKHMGGFVEKTQTEIRFSSTNPDELDAQIAHLSRIANGSKAPEEVDSKG